MNPEEAKNLCSICGDPITTQHEIDFELCDECFQQEKEDAEENDPSNMTRSEREGDYLDSSSQL